MRSGRDGLVAEDHLHHTRRVTQIDEHDAAVVAPTRHPSGHGDGLSGRVPAQRTGEMSAQHESPLPGLSQRFPHDRPFLGVIMLIDVRVYGPARPQGQTVPGAPPPRWTGKRGARSAPEYAEVHRSLH